jgi:hypothetical protein
MDSTQTSGSSCAFSDAQTSLSMGMCGYAWSVDNVDVAAALVDTRRVCAVRA